MNFSLSALCFLWFASHSFHMYFLCPSSSFLSHRRHILKVSMCSPSQWLPRAFQSRRKNAFRLPQGGSKNHKQWSYLGNWDSHSKDCDISKSILTIYPYCSKIYVNIFWIEQIYMLQNKSPSDSWNSAVPSLFHPKIFYPCQVLALASVWSP